MERRMCITEADEMHEGCEMNSNALLLRWDGGDLQAKLAGWRSPQSDVETVLALVAEQDHDHVESLADACAAVGIRVVGAIFPALVVGDRFATTGTWLLRCPALQPVVLVDGLEVPAHAAAARIAAAIDPLLQGRADAPTLLLVFDAMLPNIGAILENLYAMLGDRVSYLGVNAGNESFTPMPCLFDGTTLIEGGSLAMLLPTGLTSALDHGYAATQDSRIATSSHANRIVGIDWRPAFEVYQELVHTTYGVELTRENFYNFGVHFPFGILRATGEILVRIPVALGDDGSIVCVGDIPENSLLVVLKAPDLENRDGIARIAAAVAPALRQDSTLLTFYCAGRRLHFGAAAQDELAQLLDLTKAGPMVGALSLGEIGATASGYPLFHNAAIVALPWDAAS
jgi:hypothetical protein